MSNNEVVVIKTYKPEKISYAFLLTSFILIGIGVSTLFYTTETVFFRPFFIGLVTIGAGIIATLHCLHIIKSATFANNAIFCGLFFRVVCALLDITLGTYTAARMASVLIWTLITGGFILVRKFIEVIEDLRLVDPPEVVPAEEIAVAVREDLLASLETPPHGIQLPHQAETSSSAYCEECSSGFAQAYPVGYLLDVDRVETILSATPETMKLPTDGSPV